MGTTAETFYPHSVNWDGVDPASGDVRTCETVLPALDTQSSVDFGTSGAKTITVDPYTLGRTTTGLDPAFGWAIDIAGADGMDGTATAKRVLKEGVWFYEGRVEAGPVAAVAAVTVGFNVYRVAAAPSTTRTLLFSDSVSAGTVSTAGTNYSRTTPSQSAIVLEAGETIQVTYTLTGTGQVGGLNVKLHTGNSVVGNDCSFFVPAPGVRTDKPQTVTVEGRGTVSRSVAAALTRTLIGRGVASASRAVQASFTTSVTGRGTVTRTLAGKRERTVTGKGTATGRVEMDLDDVPEGGGGGGDTIIFAVMD